MKTFYLYVSAFLTILIFLIIIPRILYWLINKIFKKK